MTAVRTRRRNAARRLAAHPAPVATHELPGVDLKAYRGTDGRWYFLGVRAGDEPLYDYQVAQLVPIPPLAG